MTTALTTLPATRLEPRRAIELQIGDEVPAAHSGLVVGVELTETGEVTFTTVAAATGRRTWPPVDPTTPVEVVRPYHAPDRVTELANPTPRLAEIAREIERRRRDEAASMTVLEPAAAAAEDAIVDAARHELPAVMAEPDPHIRVRTVGAGAHGADVVCHLIPRHDDGSPTQTALCGIERPVAGDRAWQPGSGDDRLCHRCEVKL